MAALTQAQRQQYLNARRPLNPSNPARTVLQWLRYYPTAWPKPIGPTVAELLVRHALQNHYASARSTFSNGPHSARLAWAMAYRYTRSTQASRDLRY